MPKALTVIVLAFFVVIGLGCQALENDNPLASLIEPLMPPKPREVAADLFNISDADKRRRSVALLTSASFGGEEAYVRAYRLLIDDPDPTVRAACVNGLGLHGDTEDVPVILLRLTDRVAFVRWEAAKALQKLHDPRAITPLINSMMRDEDADVRQAAATALGQYATSGVFDALVGALDDSNFSVVHAAGESLRLLTGQSIGDDGGAWLAWSRDNRSNLFAQRQTYVWQPYVKPPGMMDKVQFWKDRPAPPPRLPVGMSDGDSGAL